MGWRPFGRVSRQLDELLVRTARQTVGDDVELMVDAGGSEQFWPHGVCWARETAKMLGDYGVVWFEEALRPDDVEGFRELRQTSPVLVATGEVLTRRQAFQPFIAGRAVDIIQPDVTKCGGLSEARRLAWLAADFGVLLVPHGWNTAVGVAADLALSAAMPVARWVEFQTGVPYIEEILTAPFESMPTACYRFRPDRAWGSRLDWDAVQHSAAGRESAFDLRRPRISSATFSAVCSWRS